MFVVRLATKNALLLPSIATQLRSMSALCRMPVDLTPRYNVGSKDSAYPFIEGMHVMETTIDPHVKSLNDAGYFDEAKYPVYKTKLTIKPSKIKFMWGDLEKKIFMQLVGGRFHKKSSEVWFVSRHIPDHTANENRCFDLYKAVRVEANRLAHQFLCEDAGEIVFPEKY